jgi:hypothetical protein
MNSKKISITDANPASISGANATSYFYGGTLERKISSTGTYQFPVGSFNNFQSAIVSTNNLAGVSSISVTHTSGAVTGTAPNTTLNGISVTATLNGGWFSITPNAQPTSGTYNATLKIKGSSNTIADANRYAVIKRDNSTSPWSVNGIIISPTFADGIVSATANGLTSFSDFAIGIGETILPVNFTSFTAKADANKSQLQWVTAAEINNKGFNVQHSIDGITYNNIGFVTGQGTVVNSNRYSFTHNNPVIGKNYYRLQQIDQDGAQHYSGVQTVTINQLSATLKIYPNPVVSNINFNRNFDAGTTLQIINISGQVVEQAVFSGNQYKLKTRVKGMYRILIKTTSDTIVGSITIQ